MKKSVVAVLMVLCLGIGFFGGKQYESKQQEILDSNIMNSHIGFAVDIIEKDDENSALASMLYVAEMNCHDDLELADALHTLWEAVVFYGDEYENYKDDLTKALSEKDAAKIKEIAMEIKINNSDK